MDVLDTTEPSPVRQQGDMERVCAFSKRRRAARRRRRRRRRGGAGPREAQWPLLGLPGASGTEVKGWALTTAP